MGDQGCNWMCWYNCTHEHVGTTAVRDRLSNLALCLRDAGVLCAANEDGANEALRYVWDCTDGRDDDSTVVPQWEPGCGRPAPSLDGRGRDVRGGR